MKAWLMDDFKGIGGLRLADVPDPLPQPDEVILQVHYAALNPADRYLAEGQYPAKPPLPHILGRDGMGTVVEMGSEVKEVRVGERRAILRGEVGGIRAGTFAQRVAVPAQDLVEIPAGWTEPEAAGATLVYLTAYQALTMWGPLPPSAVVLVTGASGGVGVAAVQLAAAMGYKVLALSRSPEKSRRLEQLGATATFNPEDPKWRQAAKALLAPRRVDLAIDNIGGKLLPEVIDTLGEHGPGQPGRTPRRAGPQLQHRHPVLPPAPPGGRGRRRLDQRREPRGLAADRGSARARRRPPAGGQGLPVRPTAPSLRAPGTRADGQGAVGGGSPWRLSAGSPMRTEGAVMLAAPATAPAGNALSPRFLLKLGLSPQLVTCKEQRFCYGVSVDDANTQ